MVDKGVRRYTFRILDFGPPWRNDDQNTMLIILYPGSGRNLIHYKRSGPGSADCETDLNPKSTI